MTKQVINIGTAPNAKNGDALRTAFEKVNANFTELYNTAAADVQIPTQANNGGKYLTTNGTVLSWATVTGGGTGDRLVNGLNEVVLGADGNLTFPDGLTIDNSVIGYATSNTVSEEIPGGTISSTSIVENQIAIDSTNSITISKVTTQISNDGVTTTTDSTGSRLEINNTGASIKRYIDPDGPNNAIYFQVRTDTSGAVLEGVEENIGYTTYGRVTASQGVVEVSTGTDSSNNVWQFGTDGNLTLPVGSDILDSTGTSVLHSGAELVGEGVTQVGSSLVIATDSGGGLTGWSSTAASIAYDANILSTYAVGSTITFQDNTTATLTQVDDYGPGSIDIFWNTPKTGTLFPITLKTADYIAAEPVTARITATGKQWTFNENGKLTLPAGTTYEYLNTPLTGHGDGLARLDFSLVTDGVITEWMAASASPAGTGYSPGDTFTFNAAFLGIPGASVTIEVLTIGLGGSVENLGFTPGPLYPADIYRNSPVNLQVGAESNRWTFKADGTLAVPGAIKQGISKLDLNADGSGNVYLTTTTDDTTALFMNSTGIQTFARESLSLYAGTTLAATQQLWAEVEQVWVDVRDQDAAIIAPATRPWAGLPSYQAYNIILNTFPVEPAAPGNLVPAANDAKNAYNTWQNALDNTSVSIGVSNSSWAFKADGSLSIGGNTVHISTNGYNTAFANANTVIYTAKVSDLASIRVHASIEGQEVGDTTGYHTQACDMMIVRRVSNLGVSTVDSVVYGVIYTGTGPLATLDAQWNAVTNKIEITATPVSTTNNVFVKVYATEVARGD